MFSKSKRFGEIHGAKGPGPATYAIKRLFDDLGAQKPKQRAGKPKDLSDLPLDWPMRAGKPKDLNPMLLGKKGLMVQCKKPLRKEPVKVEAQDLPTEECNDSNDWLQVFACNAKLASGGTGVVFSGKLKANGTPCALKRILRTDSEELAMRAMQFFTEFEIMKGCHHPHIARVFSSYQLPFPAFTMELLGKTLDQRTCEQNIDNEGVLVAFKNAASAVQYLHSVRIVHRDIKPFNLCHHLHCQSWEVKLIDFDAAEVLDGLEDHAKTCPATPAYAPTGVGPWGIFNEWKNWKMADLDIFALGKTFQEIVSEKGRALREPFKSEFRMIQERLLHPDQLLQQALEDAQAAGARQRALSLIA